MRIRDWSSDVCSADLTSIGNDRHFERLSSGLEEARAKGATIETVNPAGEDFSGTNARKMPLHIVRDATDDMIVMQAEIFGPILPVRRYDTIDGAIGEVNRRSRPLGPSYVGRDAAGPPPALHRATPGRVTAAHRGVPRLIG